MQRRRDYPSFYTRLYGFLDRDVLHLKHRARFFRLTELFLSSTCVRQWLFDCLDRTDEGLLMMRSARPAACCPRTWSPRS